MESGAGLLSWQTGQLPTCRVLSLLQLAAAPWCGHRRLHTGDQDEATVRTRRQLGVVPRAEASGLSSGSNPCSSNDQLCNSE